MACAVECMAPHMGEERPDQRGEHCGVASVQAVKEPKRAPEQVRRVRSAMMQDLGSVVRIFSGGDGLERQHQSQKSHHLLLLVATLFRLLPRYGASMPSELPWGAKMALDPSLMACTPLAGRRAPGGDRLAGHERGCGRVVWREQHTEGGAAWRRHKIS